MPKPPAEPRPGEPITRHTATDGRTSYWTILDYAPPGAARQQRRRSFPTLTAARAHVAQVKADRERHALPLGGATFAQVTDDYVSDRGRRVRPDTLRGYVESLRYAREAFGDTPVDQVTRADVERLADSMRHLSARTAKGCLSHVRAVLRRAQAEGRVVRNVADTVQAHSTPPQRRTPMSVSEVQAVATTAQGHRLAAAWGLTLVGLRRSEVLGLQWGDFDAEAGTLTVQRSRVRNGRSDQVAGPKTQRGKRVLPLSPDLLAAVRSWRATLANEFGVQVLSADRFLFVDECGIPIRPERYSDEWGRLCRAAGITRRVKLHEARHSSVVAMRTAGMPDRLVAAWHGHDEGIMRRTYDHADRDLEGLAQIAAALAIVQGRAVGP